MKLNKLFGNLIEAAKPKVSKKTGNTFIMFNVPHSILGGIKADNSNKEVKLNVLAKKIDGESMAFVGVPISGLLIPKNSNSIRLSGFYFKDSDGNPCIAYSSGEGATSFNLTISKLTSDNAKSVKSFEKPFEYK